MRTKATHRALMLAQAGFLRDVRAMFADAARQIGGAVTAAADTDGRIAERNQRALKIAVGRIVSDLFTPGDNRSAYADDGVTPRSPYATILNKWLAIATFYAIQEQEQWLKAHIPADVFAALRMGRRSVGQVAEAVDPKLMAFAKEMRLFAPSPFTKIDPERRWVPPHKWTDDKGYRLSDRIWRVDEETRRKIDEVLTQALRDGMDAIKLSRILTAYLDPMATKRTDKPYNVSVNYGAMRLARTEISRAFNEAAYTAGVMNPYVTGYDVARSRNGDPSCPVCPQHATIDMSGTRVREPYPMEGGRQPPNHPHCVTPGQMVTTLRGDIPIEQVVQGDYVLTHRGRFQRVIAAWSRPYDGFVHKIQTPVSSFEITSEHPVLTANGWTDAEAIQTSDKIVYAELNIFQNRGLGIAESNPSQSIQKRIPARIGGTFEMPEITIAFNSNAAFNKRKVDGVRTDSEFSLIDDTAPIKFGSHQVFDVGQWSILSDFSASLQSLPDTGIMPSLGFGYFGSDIGTLGGVVDTDQISVSVDLFESGTGFSGASAVITCPLCANTFTLGTGSQAEMQQKLLERAILHTEALGDFGYSKMLSDVEITHNRFNGLPELEFDTFDVVNQRGFVVAGAAVSPFAGSTTQLTDRVSHRDNLLLLSPDKAGIESGNSIVSEVANLAQAHVYYTTVEGVITRHYTGPVYNMEVEGDNSYTVNGAAVHNCMCVIRVVTQNPKDVTAQIRERLQNSYTEINVNPSNAQNMTVNLLGMWSLAIITAWLMNT